MMNCEFKNCGKFYEVLGFKKAVSMLELELKATNMAMEEALLEDVILTLTSTLVEMENDLSILNAEIEEPTRHVGRIEQCTVCGETFHTEELADICPTCFSKIMGRVK